ncbi:MAG: hypothetical protein V4466_11610 [Pseudomonadota bacterium]
MSSNVLSSYLGVGLIAARPSGADFGADEIGWYYATDTAQMFHWTGAAWALSSAGPAGSANKSANFNVTHAAGRYYIDTSGGAYTATLPASPATDEEYEFWDASGNAGANPVSFDGNGNNIAGSGTLANFIAVDFGRARLVFDGTQWLAQGS